MNKLNILGKWSTTLIKTDLLYMPRVIPDEHAYLSFIRRRISFFFRTISMYNFSR